MGYKQIALLNRVKSYFLWRDFWIGFFYNKLSETLYVQFIPMFGIRIDISNRNGGDIE